MSALFRLQTETVVDHSVASEDSRRGGAGRSNREAGTRVPVCPSGPGPLRDALWRSLLK